MTHHTRSDRYTKLLATQRRGPAAVYGALDEPTADMLYDPLGSAAAAQAAAIAASAPAGHTHTGVYQPLDAQLTSLTGLAYAGNASKYVRVNAGETDFELATVVSGGGGSLDDILALQALL